MIVEVDFSRGMEQVMPFSSSSDAGYPLMFGGTGTTLVVRGFMKSHVNQPGVFQKFLDS